MNYSPFSAAADRLLPPTRRLPAHPDLLQLKRQAKELLKGFLAHEVRAVAEVRTHYRAANPSTFALHDAQLVVARTYGFASWPKLKAFVDGVRGECALIKPAELESAEGRDTWDTIVAASAGDVVTLRRLLERDPRLARAGYWYAPAVHFAVRDGHVESVRLLLDAGADPEQNGLNDRNLIEMARERGHERIARMLEEERERLGRVAAQAADHPIHRAASLGQIDAVRALLDADPELVNLGSRRGITPLQCAVHSGSLEMVNLLIERGAKIHARSPDDLQAIDFAVWSDHRLSVNDDVVRLLVARGASYDLTIASALGDLAGVRQMLDDDPSRVREARPNGRRPLSAAVDFGQDDVVRLLLERGVNPRWEEPGAPRGRSLHSASRIGNLAMVKLLLEHGADPNEAIDSTANAVAFAATPEIRALLESRGGGLDEYDTSWIEGDNEGLRRVAGDSSDTSRIGTAFTMSADRPDLLSRLLGAGLRMPEVHTGCQGYLLKPDALRLLLANGMNPDQTNWQHQTLLHHACTKDTTECAAILLDAGATITARDDEYRSTPLGWAARTNKPRMVEFLLSRGAPVDLSDDEPWATPLAWAVRRGHEHVAAILREHGARQRRLGDVRRSERTT